MSLHFILWRSVIVGMDYSLCGNHLTLLIKFSLIFGQNTLDVFGNWLSLVGWKGPVASNANFLIHCIFGFRSLASSDLVKKINFLSRKKEECCLPIHLQQVKAQTVI